MTATCWCSRTSPDHHGVDQHGRQLLPVRSVQLPSIHCKVVIWKGTSVALSSIDGYTRARLRCHAIDPPVAFALGELVHLPVETALLVSYP